MKRKRLKFVCIASIFMFGMSFLNIRATESEVVRVQDRWVVKTIGRKEVLC